MGACFGGEVYAQKLLRWNRHILDAYADTPKFLISWLTGAHRDFRELVELEPLLLRHVQHILQSAALQNTVFIVMGDHGQHAISCDYTAPFLYILAPKSWDKSSATSPLLEALRGNVARQNSDTAHQPVVSHWDLYATFRHLLSLGFPGADDDHFGLRELSGADMIQ